MKEAVKEEEYEEEPAVDAPPAPAPALDPMPPLTPLPTDRTDGGAQNPTPEPMINTRMFKIHIIYIILASHSELRTAK